MSRLIHKVCASMLQMGANGIKQFFVSWFVSCSFVSINHLCLRIGTLICKNQKCEGLSKINIWCYAVLSELIPKVVGDRLLGPLQMIESSKILSFVVWWTRSKDF